MNFSEKIDLDYAKYLLSVSFTDLKKFITDDGKSEWNWDENGETPWNNYEKYAIEVRKYLRRGIKLMETKGHIPVEYTYSRNMVETGRIFSRKTSLQQMCKYLRGVLIAKYVNDFDMVNAHPCILYNLIKTYFPAQKNSFPIFRYYVKRRDEFFQQLGETMSREEKKRLVLIALNSSKLLNNNNQLFRKLDKEIKQIQQLIWNNYEIANPDLSKVIIAKKAELKRNKEGRYINMVLCDKENQILQEAMKLFEGRVHTPMFDGFTLDNSIPIEEGLRKLNENSKKYGVKWSMKPHDTKIKIPDDFEYNIKFDYTYSEQKERFEKSHFVIENPLMFGREYEIDGETKYQFYSKEKFRDLVKPIKYFEVDPETGKDICEFFPEWLSDESRRSYKELRFVPKATDSDEFYNSFRGFEYTESVEEHDDENDYVIEHFTNHIKLLTNYDDEAGIYLMKYIAHLLQKPDELPQTAIILKSKQGYGKDTLIDFIEKMIGKQYIFRTAEMDDVFGTYNVGIRDKLVLQLNEVEGKGGFTNKEKIKNVITENRTVIREKYISQYDQNNYLRLFILSNNINPIEITYDDRRFAVFKAHHKKPSAEYFTQLHAMKDDEEQMNILYNYFMKMDISDFSPRNDRPKTEAYDNMKKHNENPIYQFLWDCFIDDAEAITFSTGECKRNKKTGDFYVRSDPFFRKYKEVLQSEEKGYIIPTFKMIKAILADIGINQKKVKINGSVKTCYIIKPSELKEHLDTMGVIEEVEELDNDDFEDTLIDDEGNDDNETCFY